jgi:hypothetical protein
MPQLGTSPATADATFNQQYADIRITHPVSGVPILQMGRSQVVHNLQLEVFTLSKLLNDPEDCGLKRGDWVVLNNPTNASC